ncbi:MAG: nucleoside-diphosphate kinase [Oscillospiraceae bacterium]|nr:nucleoside-diphosphate kinase [Oscillospiraceae bacterium]MCL2227764.1 nucleoside-diphosphate kinase [Oscillospiraceae bacterium]
MGKERTFVMLKPDCIKRGLVGEVISKIERKGWRIVDAKMRVLEPAFLYTFYEHIKDQPYFLKVFNYMLSGTVLGMVVEGEDAVMGMRRLIGPTIIEEALPGTIRGDFAMSSANSLIHASKTDDNVKDECNIFFKS